MIRLLVGTIIGIWIAGFCVVGYNLIRPEDQTKIRKPIIGFCLLGYGDMLLVELGLFGFGMSVSSYIMVVFFALELSQILCHVIRH